MSEIMVPMKDGQYQWPNRPEFIPEAHRWSYMNGNRRIYPDDRWYKLTDAQRKYAQQQAKECEGDFAGYCCFMNNYMNHCIEQNKLNKEPIVKQVLEPVTVLACTLGVSLAFALGVKMMDKHSAEIRAAIAKAKIELVSKIR